jgi:hypothetical protein
LKHGKNPTLKQKKMLKKLHLIPKNWLVVGDNGDYMLIKSKGTGRVKTIMKGGEKHMSKKYEVADWLTLESAESIHEVGVALVITDGKYAQIVKEDDEN